MDDMVEQRDTDYVADLRQTLRDRVVFATGRDVPGGVDQESDHLFIGSLAGDEEAVLQLMRLVPLVHTSHQHRFEDLKLLTHLWVVLFSAQLEAVDDLGSLRCATI